MKKYFTLLGAMLISGIVFSQTGINAVTPQATLDVVGKPTENSVFDGIIAPRIEGAQLRAKTYTTSQKGALVYVTTADTAPSGQTIDVTAEGYYYFNGTKWVNTGAGNDINIYKDNGTLTSNRVLSTSDNSLEFNINALQRTYWSYTNGSLSQMGLATSPTKHASIQLIAADNNDNSITSRLTFQMYPESTAQIMAGGDASALTLSTHLTTNSAPIIFQTSAGSNAPGNEKMRITGEGRVRIGTGGNPTEQLHVIGGNVRLMELPLNGTPNAINTLPGGGASSSQNQTFNATRTVVADANGVLGTVTGIPSDAGTSRVLVNANVPGTQNLVNAFNPPVIAQFTIENLDTYNAWTNNVFTVPAGLGGLYIVAMQNSNSHVSTGSETPTWHTMAFFEKSIDGGTNWSILIKDTYSNIAGTVVDNGNNLYWTGFLNDGDRLRVRFNCNSTTNNMVEYGGLSITKLAQ